MEIKTKISKGRCTMNLAGDMNIYSAMQVKQELMEALDKSTELEINLSRVTEMDSAGMQLLILAKRESLANGKTLRLVKHSTAVLEVMELYDLVATFGDPLVMQAGRTA